MKIDNLKNISIGNRTFISQGAWLCSDKNNKSVTIKIGNNTSIGHFSHIVGWYDLSIGNNVMIANKVFISDCTHRYIDIDTPIKYQPIDRLKDESVTIGDDTWIGENVCILGASIGKHCVIGSNSVVTKDIPDYCVVAGAPARIVKKYSKETNTWQKV